MQARSFPPGVSTSTTQIIDLLNLDASVEAFATVVKHSVIFFDPNGLATNNVTQTAAEAWGVLYIDEISSSSTGSITYQGASIEMEPICF
jgi:hypothetical protein